ncbi:hypothetical protein [Endozoicomonas sp. 8E]|nr:hypothetical protein [Endozoicomonas sp. 8E]WOG27501.1 hypothetical protein P6910_23605 [Endozoicomonas sp. 8E]
MSLTCAQSIESMIQRYLSRLLSAMLYRPKGDYLSPSGRGETP